MKMIFKNPRIFQRMHDGPLGSCIESYAAEMREQGYCAGAMESQIRLVADFSRWMMKTRFHPELYIPYQQFPWLMDGPHNLLVRTFAGVNPESLNRAVVGQLQLGRSRWRETSEQAPSNLPG